MDLPQIEMERPRNRPGLEKVGTIVPKETIQGLKEHDLEIAEVKQRILYNITCEHNLRVIPSLTGSIIVTNFKVIFKPNT